MSQPNLLELAKQGDAKAIAALMNRQLQPKGITAKTGMKNDCLQIMLESSQAINQTVLVNLIHQSLVKLKAEPIKRVKVYGRRSGEEFPDWQQDVELEEPENIDIVVSELTVAVEDESSSLVPQQSHELAPQKQSMWGSIFGAVTGAAGTVGSAAISASGTVAGAVAGAAVGVGSVIGGAAMQATEGVGYVFDVVSNSPQLEQLTKALKVDWLIKLIDQVDIVKAETEVRRLQQQYPHEQPSDIAHRVMLEKALFAGGTGLASSIVPGTSVALFAVDLAANMLLQAEMVYQIACAYGFDLKEPARKGEIVAIFGLSVGGGQALKTGTSYAIKAGLTFIESVPLAGAVIGASANAAMIYALGYGACRFYEAKLNPLTMEATLVEAQVESQKYLEAAISQEIVMDWILVHVVLAGHPGQTLEQILPELKALNLSPASVEAIATNLETLPPLESLLNQINSDFAIPLVAQCRRIAQLDEVVTPEEAKVIDIITKHLDVDWGSIQELTI